MSYGSSQPFSWTYADFYNWDWGNGNEDAWTDHSIELSGYPDGGYDDDWVVDAWGEDA